MDNFFLNKNLKANPFKVPENYFNELNDKITSLKNITAAENGSKWEVPEQYFDRLEGQIMAQVNISEHGKAEAFQVPDDYFVSLENRIKAQTTAKKTSTVRPLSFIRYAAAAAILIFCALSFYFINNSQPSINKQLASIPDQEIEEYLEYSSDPSDMSLIVENANLDDFELNVNRPITN